VVSQPSDCAGTGVLLKALVEREVVEAGRGLVRPEPARSEAEAASWAPLQAAVQALLQAADVPVAGVALAHFEYRCSCIADRVFVLQAAAGALTPWTTAVVRSPDGWKRKDTLVLNADHPSIAPLWALARREPEFAAYTLLKLVHLSVGPLPIEIDSQLATASTTLRARRLEPVP
jgi:hypothetical protein